ncbi:DNA polymerase III, gamma subunit /DNA polymerase III, tau subunit [Marinobacter daqiaonensis]|uniref:DNA polymerase III subunit gamma/tau n=1 Tax=Marinobacter daqiaonensis TaxID=650891 RepID=A0A1I6GX85_9GAMM|nr:DNA polymerase III subunit gamma/tau [Marinobacter daqiaonensis]SFR46845.1 DNA polymerase III, gamma subunit /DNA polymerase III, tau subunit [Marinobacter daqiaonensis]
MSYQVLARKWRPRTFEDMVGQEHVLQALVHALEHNRLHHAYLFTGTRGVGKTTIGRLLARCLNCETGVTAKPCGECSSCREILDGRFVDLIEIDAASRTGVDDMRELTDNVQYAPTRGRYKVYLIDEVHMLTNQSFNAFLKTLEEPPEHVKFLLATTDPQKLPVTVLSRCLQFNLKRMTPEHIVGHLRFILGEESIPFEDPALWQLARAADGSMRDALSLTDQAIAFGNQKLAASDVSSMLGTIDQRDIEKLVDALVANNGPELLAEIGRISDFAPDFNAILADLLSLFHRVTMEQVVPGSVDNAMGDAHRVQALARELSGEDAQLFYQAALIGRKDLDITPDARMGFEMTLLRMLAFRPGVEHREPPATSTGVPARVGQRESSDRGSVDSASGDAGEEPAPAVSEKAAPQPGRKAEVPSAEEPAPSAPPAAAIVDESAPLVASGFHPDYRAEDDGLMAMADQMAGAADVDDAPPWDEAPSVVEPEKVRQPRQLEEHRPIEKPQSVGESQPVDEPRSAGEPRKSGQPGPAPGRESSPAVEPPPVQETLSAGRAPEQSLAPQLQSGDGAVPVVPEPLALEEGFVWARDFRKLGIVGMAGNLASQAACERDGNRFVLTLDEGHYRLLNDRHQERILEGLRRTFGDEVRIEVRVGEAGDQTPIAWEARARARRQQEAEQAIEQDPLVSAIVERFEGRVVKESIRPVQNEAG